MAAAQMLLLFITSLISVGNGALVIESASYRCARSGETKDLEKNSTVYPRDVLLLKAAASGYTPEEPIVWLRDNDTLYAGDGVSIWSNYSASNTSVVTGSTLEYDVSSDDAGKKFGCRVENEEEYLPFVLMVGEAPSRGLHYGIIIAIVAALVLIPVIVGIVVWCVRRQKKQKSGAMEVTVEKQDGNTAEKGQLLDGTGEANSKPSETEMDAKKVEDASREGGDGKEEAGDK